jgi:hypothetical protein
MGLKGLGKLTKTIHLIGSRIRDLLARSKYIKITFQMRLKLG